MGKKNQQQGDAPLLVGLSVENAKAIVTRYSRAELDAIFEEAKEVGRKVVSCEDIYAQRVPDEIMRKPFEIVR